MSNKAIDLLVQDLEAEVQRVYAYDASSVITGTAFTRGYMHSFFVALIKRLPHDAVERVMDEMVDRIIYLRNKDMQILADKEADVEADAA